MSTNFIKRPQCQDSIASCSVVSELYHGQRQNELNWGFFRGYQRAKRTRNGKLIFCLLFISECYLHNILKLSSCVKVNTVTPLK
jgi:hypothetical protein